MDLKPAATIAKRFADTTKAAADGFGLVRISHGWLEACNAAGGCRVPVHPVQTPADLDIRVDASKLLDMLRRLKNPTLRRESPAVIRIEGDDGSFFQLRGKRKGPALPEPPAVWQDLPAAQAQALAAVAALAGKDDPHDTIRLTPTWAATYTNSSAIVAWVAGLVSKPVTYLAKPFAKLKGDHDIGQKGGRVWLRDAAGVETWASEVVSEWPDAIVSARFPQVRTGEARVAFPVDAAQLAVLGDRAFAAADTLADAYALAWTTDSTLALRGGGADGQFIGAQPVPIAGDNRVFGIEPRPFAAHASAVASAAGGAAHYMAIGKSHEPILLWCVEPVAVEAMLMPVFLPTAPA